MNRMSSNNPDPIHAWGDCKTELQSLQNYSSISWFNPWFSFLLIPTSLLSIFLLYHSVPVNIHSLDWTTGFKFLGLGLIFDSAKSHADAHFWLFLLLHDSPRQPNIWPVSSKNKKYSFMIKRYNICHIYRMSHNVFLPLLSYDVLPPSV